MPQQAQAVTFTARACRIDDVVVRPDGAYEVRYTFGPTPLPASWQGTAFVLSGGANDIASNLQMFLDNASADGLAMYAFARWLRLDATATNVSLIRGKTVTLDASTTGVLSIT